MVLLHGIAAGRATTRTSRDVDVIADLLTDRGGLQRCVRAVRELDLEPRPDLDGCTASDATPTAPAWTAWLPTTHRPDGR